MPSPQLEQREQATLVGDGISDERTIRNTSHRGDVSGEDLFQGAAYGRWPGQPSGRMPFPGIVVIRKIHLIRENVRMNAAELEREGGAALVADHLSAGSWVN